MAIDISNATIKMQNPALSTVQIFQSATRSKTRPTITKQQQLQWSPWLPSAWPWSPRLSAIRRITQNQHQQQIWSGWKKTIHKLQNVQVVRTGFSKFDKFIRSLKRFFGQFFIVFTKLLLALCQPSMDFIFNSFLFACSRIRIVNFCIPVWNRIATSQWYWTPKVTNCQT